MTVTFQHPPTETKNSFKDFKPKKPEHYPTHKYGVYIWGLKMEIDEVEKFVPIYVGIGDLYKRLWSNHRNITKQWYFFDYESVRTLADLSNLYNGIDKGQRYEFLGASPFRYSDNLLYFNDSNFFTYKIPGYTFSPNPLPHPALIKSRLVHLQNSYKSNPNPDLKNLIDRTDENIKFYQNNFYYIYASFSDDIKIGEVCSEDDKVLEYLYSSGDIIRLCERIEYSTKIALRELGIFTGAKATLPSLEMNLDFTKVKDELVDLGKHSLGSPYPNPLILKSR